MALLLVLFAICEPQFEKEMEEPALPPDLANIILDWEVIWPPEGSRGNEAHPRVASGSSDAKPREGRVTRGNSKTREERKTTVKAKPKHMQTYKDEV